MPLSGELKLDIVKQYYGNDRSLTKTLNPCDYYFWGFLKSRVYSDPVPQTTEQLKQNIRREVRRIKQTTVSSAVDNLLVRIQNLVFQKGSWFEQIINY